MNVAKFKTFRIEILSKEEDIQIELAKVGDKDMLIATDLARLVSPNIFHQEAYGPDIIDEQMKSILIEELRKRILNRRKTFEQKV